jgi:hypothetical protein
MIGEGINIPSQKKGNHKKTLQALKARMVSPTNASSQVIFAGTDPGEYCEGLATSQKPGFLKLK